MKIPFTDVGENNPLYTRILAAYELKIVTGKTTTTFADNGEIANYARNAVAFMSGHEIFNGVGGSRFNPKEQALKIAVEMLDKLGK